MSLIGQVVEMDRHPRAGGDPFSGRD